MRNIARGLTAAALLLALAASPAGAAPHKTKHHHKDHRCRRGYVLKHKRVRRRRHGHMVRVRVTVCVRRPKHRRRAPKLTPKPTPVAAVPAAPPTLKLHAHVDPTFTRDAADPFAVRYAYSASATVTKILLNGAESTEADPTLPEGVLNLYNDGILACSINVGGENKGGECPVTYSSLGHHTVTTIYTSGSASATETVAENVEPLAVTTSVSVAGEAYEPAHQEGEGACEPDPGAEEPVVQCDRIMLGKITVSAAVGGAPTGVVTAHVHAPVCNEGGSCFSLWPPGGVAQSASLTLYEWAQLERGSQEQVRAFGLVASPTLAAARRCFFGLLFYDCRVSEAWTELLSHALSLEGLLSERYVATATFVGAGYTANEATVPLLVKEP